MTTTTTTARRSWRSSTSPPERTKTVTSLSRGARVGTARAAERKLPHELMLDLLVGVLDSPEKTLEAMYPDTYQSMSLHERMKETSEVMRVTDAVTRRFTEALLSALKEQKVDADRI